MKKTSKILTAVLAAAMIPTSGISANAQEPDYSLWEKFLKYDLCITDYSSLTEEEKELCKFIFETEQSADETVICERARRTLAHDENVGERITLEQLDGAYGIWDNYSKNKTGWQGYLHCVPDIKYLDGWYDYNEYWTDDEGTVKIRFKGESTGRNYEDFDVVGEGSIPALKENSPYNSFNFKIEKELLEEYGYIKENGGYYHITPDGNAVLLKCESSADSHALLGEAVTEPYVIPDEVNGCPVVAIGEDAMRYTPFTEVVIPETVKIIDRYAFGGCDYLEKVNFPKGLQYIGANAFFLPNTEKLDIDCPDLYISRGAISGGIKEANINAREIGEYAFTPCYFLNKVTFGEDVEKIDANAFKMCDSLESVEFSSNIRSVGQGAFQGEEQINAEGIKSITIPPTVEIIGALPEPVGESALSGMDAPATRPLTDDPVCVFNSDCVISGYRGTEAERYAKEWNLTFVELEAEKGDVNLDGEITVADAVTLQNYLLGRYVKTGTAYGDMDDDGRIDSFDMIMIRKKLV